jgi:hypothetical protein
MEILKWKLSFLAFSVIDFLSGNGKCVFTALSLGDERNLLFGMKKKEMKL